jgi:hypothetical protein
VEILIGIAIALIAGALVSAFGYTIWRYTRDVRTPNFELFEVEPDVVCIGDTCPIVIRHRVTNVGADQQVNIRIRYRPTRTGVTETKNLGVEPVGEIALLPNLVNFPDGGGFVSFEITVRAITGDVFDPPPPIGSDGISLMADDEPIATFTLQGQSGDQAVGRITLPMRFLGDVDTDLAARTPESISRFCKNSQLTALSLGGTRIFTTDGSIAQDSPLSVDATVNQQNLYNLPPGQVVNLQNPLPIGDGIMIEATVPPPAGVTEWPALSQISCSILLHITCPN